jgi:Domain of unknown function (DUF4416)
MAQLSFPDPVLLVVAVFSRHPDAVAWAGQRLEQDFGAIARASHPYNFNQTAYYEASMGPGLQKQFFVFHDLVAADSLPEVKLRTNVLESELVATSRYPETRPINIDPGILTLGKFLLATTKDQAHRIYLRDGIHAEVTLRFQAGAFEPWEWTYADYRLPTVRAFLKEAREFYRQQLIESKARKDKAKNAEERVE